MAVTVQFGQKTATVEKRRWSSEDERLARLLNSLIDPLGPSGADPDPDHTVAVDAADRLGGQIIDADKPAPLPKGAIR